MRSTVVRSFALFAFVVFVRSASAGIINLSDGSFDPVPPPGNIGSGGPVHFEGDRGFTFDGAVGSVDEGSSVSGCFFCLPGTPIHLSAGGFPPGTATLDGLSFQTVDIHSGGFNILEFFMSGDVVAPPFGASPTATLVAPLTFSGSFDHLIDPAVPPPSGGSTIDTLVGSAEATLTLNKVEPFSPGEFRWRPTGIVYDIGPSTTPEPSSLLLVGSGLVGLAGRRAWRKRGEARPDRDRASSLL
jgi:hypothetical protein